MSIDNFKCRYYSWEQIWELSKALARKIRNSGFKPDLIIGIIRGGLIPSVNLSDFLGIRDLITLRIEHWGITATKSKRAELKYPINYDLTGKRVLIVDDLTDTGESIEIALKHIKKLNPLQIKIATLIHKASSDFEPDFYVERIEKWLWVIFPWNLNEDLGNLIKKILSKKRGIKAKEIRIELKKKFDLDIDEKTIGGIIDYL